MDLALTLLLALIKGFPLFPLLLKAKDPRRLPGKQENILKVYSDCWLEKSLPRNRMLCTRRQGRLKKTGPQGGVHPLPRVPG